MKGLLMYFVLVVAAVLQAVFPTWRWLGYANAPILLGVALYYALEHSHGMMLQAAILAGLVQDALCMIPLGYSSFCFLVAAVIASRFRDIVFVHELATHTLFGALASGGVTLALYGLLGKDNLVILRPAWALWRVAGSIALGAVLIPLEFEILEASDRMLGNIEEKET
jgi:rod shape-determining protein MreD